MPAQSTPKVTSGWAGLTGFRVWLVWLGLLWLVPVLLAASPAPQTVSVNVGNAPEVVRIVVLSDFNGPYGSVTYPAALKRTVQRITHQWKPDLVLLGGDLIAGQQTSLSDTQVRAMWAAFDREVRLPLTQAGIPFVFTLGNHDASLTRDRREAARYWGKWGQASPAPALPKVQGVDVTQFPFRYSALFQHIFISVLDASGPNVSATQREWLRQQLSSVPAQTAGVRVVMGHLPLSAVSAGKNKPGEVIREPDALSQVMQQGKALFYLSGHHAAYYPGRLIGSTVAGELNVLASGGIGGRDYVGHPGTARSTVTLLSVSPQENRASFQTFDADTGEEILTATLPSRLTGLGGTLARVSEFK